MEKTPSVTMIFGAGRPVAVLELGLQVGHVLVGVAEPLGLAQPDAVDDRRVVQLVGDDRVLRAEQRLEDAAVGVEAGGEQDGVLGAEELRDPALQLQVQVLRAADEPDAGHAEAALVHGALRRGDDVRVVGQAQVVVGAEVQHLAAGSPICRPDVAGLGRVDVALRLEQARGADLVQLVRAAGP